MRGGDAAKIVALAGVYVVVARLGLMLDAVGGFATVVWPPTGISLAALLCWGTGLWPGIAIGALVTNLWAGAPLGSALGITLGNTLEAVVAAMALRRIPEFRNSLDRVRDVVALIVFGALASTTVSATIGVLSLALWSVVPLQNLGETWRAWWVGDMIANLIVAPLLLTWSARPRVPLLRAQAIEAAALAATVAAFGLVLFGGTGAEKSTSIFSHSYMFFPLLIWAALRLGQRATITTTFMVAAIAIVGTVLHHGPFVDSSLYRGLFSLQTFMGVAAATFLVLGASMSEQRVAAEDLARAHEGLEAKVRERTAELTTMNAELARRQAQLAEAQEITHIGSWEWDVPRNALTWTEELYRIYGVPPTGASLPSYDDFISKVHPDDRARVDTVVRSSMEKAGTFEFEHRIVRTSGEVRVVHARGRVIVDESGYVQRLTGTGQDITERKSAEEALRRAHDELEQRVEERTAEIRQLLAELENAVQARDALISIASHELKTPLSALQLQVHMLSRIIAGAESGSPVIDKIRDRIAGLERQIARLTRLIDNLLDVSRINAGRLQLEYEDVDLAAAVEDVVARFDEELRRFGRRVTVHRRESIVGRWDRIRLEQIVTNLVSNAVKYGGDQPIEVTVGTARDGEYGSFEVRDYGIGIAPEDQARIFERFERLVSGRHAGGFGLGLWIVRQIVQALGGTVSVSSEVGKGTTFSVELPRRALRESPERGAQVLVVEDDRDILDSLSEMLRGQGYAVACTANGKEALDYLERERERPCLILLDLSMPVMNGREFLDAKGRMSDLAQIPVVLLSADHHLAHRAEELGAADYLPKPVDIRRLLSTLERHCPRP